MLKELFETVLLVKLAVLRESRDPPIEGRDRGSRRCCQRFETFSASKLDGYIIQKINDLREKEDMPATDDGQKTTWVHIIYDTVEFRNETIFVKIFHKFFI